jgi:hypothetical protein
MVPAFVVGCLCDFLDIDGWCIDRHRPLLPRRARIRLSLP